MIHYNKKTKKTFKMAAGRKPTDIFKAHGLVYTSDDRISRNIQDILDSNMYVWGFVSDSAFRGGSIRCVITFSLLGIPDVSNTMTIVDFSSTKPSLLHELIALGSSRDEQIIVFGRITIRGTPLKVIISFSGIEIHLSKDLFRKNSSRFEMHEIFCKEFNHILTP